VIQALRHVFLTLFWPSKGFAGVAERPRALTAVLLLILAFAAGRFVQASRLDLDSLSREAAARLSSESQGKYVSETTVQEQATRAQNLKKIVAVAGPLVAVPVFLLLLGVVVWSNWFLRLLVRGRAVPLGTWYALLAHAALPLALRQLLSIPVLLNYPAIDPNAVGPLFQTDLGAWLGSAAFPGAFLIDPFWIWIGVLTGLASRAVGYARMTAILQGILLWAVLGFAARWLIT
jgi:hypothetical protein